MKSLLAYYGGKAGPVGKWIAEFVDEIPHLNYVEPFGGMAGVLMQKRPSRTEVWNDKAEVLLNLFEVVRNPATNEQLCQALEFTAFSRILYKQCCLRQFDTTLPAVERARCTYVALSQSRGGQLKHSGWRFGGAAFDGAVAETFIRNQERIREVANRLRAVQLESGDALTIIRQWDHPHTLLYIDSPYLGETRNGGRCYLHEMVTEADHLALLTQVRGCRSKVLVSGYRSDLYARELEAYGWERREILTVAHSSAQRSAGKAKRVECLWVNPAAQQTTLFCKTQRGGLLGPADN